MKTGETYEKMAAAAATARAAAAHKTAIAEGRICACEGPHMATCGAK